MLKVSKLLSFYLILVLLISCIKTEVSSSRMAKEIDELLTALETEGLFNGVVLVAEKGDVMRKKAFGYSDFEKKEHMTAEAAFETASISKTFTAVAVLLLAERGVLSLDDSLAKFFPRLPYENVTVGRLLSHTSGLFDVPVDVELRKEFLAFYKRIDVPYTNKDYLEFLETYKPKLVAEPGAKYRYSNTAYVLLALIVERVSGQEFDEFLQENIFEPINLKNTVVFSKLKNGNVDNLAAGYRDDPIEGIVRESDLRDTSKIRGLSYGDDEIISTVTDLLVYDQALRSGKLLKPETLEKALVPPVLADGSLSRFGQGFAITVEDGFQYVFHGGSTSGFWAYCKFSRPENDNTIVLFTNVKSTISSFRAIHKALRAILRGKSYELPKRAIIYPLAEAIRKHGAKAAQERFDHLRATGKYRVEVSELNQLGARYTELDNTEAGRAVYELSLKLDPDNEFAKKKLEEIY